MSDDYSTIRELLGKLIGQRLIDITQHDEREWINDRKSYTCLMFEDGSLVRFLGVDSDDRAMELEGPVADDSPSDHSPMANTAVAAPMLPDHVAPSTFPRDKAGTGNNHNEFANDCYCDKCDLSRLRDRNTALYTSFEEQCAATDALKESLFATEAQLRQEREVHANEVKRLDDLWVQTYSDLDVARKAELAQLQTTISQLTEVVQLYRKYAPLSGDMALLIRGSQGGGKEVHERADKLVEFYEHLNEAHDKGRAALSQKPEEEAKP